MKPVPMPAEPADWDWILTTAGIALATALMTADDSSICTCDTFVPVGVCESGDVVLSSRSQLETAAADSEPDTIPATTATATMAPEPNPRRSPATSPALAIGGRVDQAGTVWRSGGRAGWGGAGPEGRTATGCGGRGSH